MDQKIRVTQRMEQNPLPYIVEIRHRGSVVGRHASYSDEHCRHLFNLLVHKWTLFGSETEVIAYEEDEFGVEHTLIARYTPSNTVPEYFIFPDA